MTNDRLSDSAALAPRFPEAMQLLDLPRFLDDLCAGRFLCQYRSRRRHRSRAIHYGPTSDKATTPTETANTLHEFRLRWSRHVAAEAVCTQRRNSDPQ